jgi:hypothetical protein
VICVVFNYHVVVVDFAVFVVVVNYHVVVVDFAVIIVDFAVVVDALGLSTALNAVKIRVLVVNGRRR